MGAPPAPVRRYGTVYARECWRDVGRSGLAVGIAAALTWLLTVLVGDSARTTALTVLYGFGGLIFAIELLWAVSATIWPKRPPRARPQQADPRAGCLPRGRRGRRLVP